MKTCGHNLRTWLAYNAALTLLFPLWAPYAAWRIGKSGRQARRDRMGFGPVLEQVNQRLWMHGASVGEMAAAKPILQRFHDRCPSSAVVVSTITLTGQHSAISSFPWAENIRYFPLDVPHAVNRTLQAVKPTLVAIVETELWPNFIYLASQRAPIVLVNGRISDKTFQSAQRYRSLYKWMFSHISVIAMQTDTDAERAEKLGAPTCRIRVLGTSKFDEAVPSQTSEDKARWRAILGLGDAPVAVAGSTFAGEDDAVCQAVLKARSVAPGLKSVIAPRRLERVPEVVQAVQNAGLKAQLRTDGPDLSADVIILNTFGELSEVYGIADVAFIGKSLTSHGGQNLIQPMAHGVPVVYGPHMENFRDVAAMAESRGAANQVRDASGLAEAWTELLSHPERRRRMGEAGRALVLENQGASDRYADLLVEAMTEQREYVW